MMVIFGTVVIYGNGDACSVVCCCNGDDVSGGVRCDGGGGVLRGRCFCLLKAAVFWKVDAASGHDLGLELIVIMWSGAWRC